MPLQSDADEDSSDDSDSSEEEAPPLITPAKKSHPARRAAAEEASGSVSAKRKSASSGGKAPDAPKKLFQRALGADKAGKQGQGASALQPRKGAAPSAPSQGPGKKGKRKAEALPLGAAAAGGGGGSAKARRRQQMLLDVVVGPPMAIVGEDERDGSRVFSMVQRVQRPASGKQRVVLRWMREGSDGLYRPAPTYWEERADALVAVRTQFLPDGTLRSALPSQAPEPVTLSSTPEAGWKLLTLKSKLLDTEWID